MSNPESRLPARPSLEQLQKQAKELLRQFRAGDESAAARFRDVDSNTATLADAQFVIARENGFETWAKLKHHIEASLRPSSAQYERIAQDVLAASRDDVDAAARLGMIFGAIPPPDQLREKIHERLKSDPAAELTLTDTQLFVARLNGFESWDRLIASLSDTPTDPRSAPHGTTSSPPFYRIDWKNNTIEPGMMVSDNDWDTIFSVMREHGITGLNAGGRMTDAALRRLSKLDQVTRLNLDGSIQITDDSVAQLARLTRLEELDLSGWKGQLTDRALDVLPHLPALKHFKICWQQHITDAGLANLRHCDQLERVNLLGAPAGDTSIAALTGKVHLRYLNTGREVTDAGLALLHQIPAFKMWQGGKITYELMGFDAGPTFLLIDGQFTDTGLAALAGLDGLFGLTFFWHCPAFTSAGIRPLKHLANLGFLGCQDAHCDDEAMQHIAAIPRLRMLMGQGAVASDEGWTALSQSQTIEFIWGRECPNLTGRGFAALAQMPALRGLAVSCKNVDDAALSALPRFPALSQLMPMDVTDEGFRHVGRCERLEKLWCMYCRDTGDIATEHIANLKLKSYYAGKTNITDRSLEILARMSTLQRLEFWQCAGVTDQGVALLATLPNLEEINLDSLAEVTREVVATFPPNVRVNYSA